MKKILLVPVVLLLGLIISSSAIVQAENATSSDKTVRDSEKKIEDKIQKVRTSADKELDKRIEDLEKLKTRISEFKNISSAEKQSIVAFVDNLVMILKNLRTEIDTTTSTTTLKEARESITKNYRVYALVMPQLNIIANADRMTTMVSMMAIVGSKLEARLNQLATSSVITSANLVSARKSLDNFKAKIADAQMQSQKAVELVANLIPDQGEKEVMDSNTLALKEARTKLKIAQSDLVTARKEAESIIKLLGKEKKAKPVQASTTPELKTQEIR